jgi:hypothetical protein
MGLREELHASTRIRLHSVSEQGRPALDEWQRVKETLVQSPPRPSSRRHNDAWRLCSVHFSGTLLQRLLAGVPDRVFKDCAEQVSNSVTLVLVTESETPTPARAN